MSNSTYILNEDLVANNWIRLAHYFLDIIFILLTTFVASVFFAIIATFLGFHEMLFWMQNLSDLEGKLIFIFFSIFYYTITEGLFGRSVAKFITGTVVVDENGDKPSFGTLFKRTLCRLIPFDGLSFFGSRGWHDSMSDTYVVHKKALSEDIRDFNDFKLIGAQEIEE